MRTLDVLDADGRPAGQVELPAAVFDYPAKGPLVHETVVGQLANRRQGTVATKTRADVSGGGKKPWRQKGTGRARAGSNRSPLWRKGGTTFGPQPRDYTQDLTRQARRNALRSVLADKHAGGRMLVLSAFELAEPRTKAAAALLKGLNLRSALLVDDGGNRNLFLAVRNIPRVKAVDVRSLNVVDALRYETLVLSRKAFETLMERFQ